MNDPGNSGRPLQSSTSNLKKSYPGYQGYGKASSNDRDNYGTENIDEEDEEESTTKRKILESPNKQTGFEGNPYR